MTKSFWIVGAPQALLVDAASFWLSSLPMSFLREGVSPEDATPAASARRGEAANGYWATLGFPGTLQLGPAVDRALANSV